MRAEYITYGALLIDDERFAAVENPEQWPDTVKSPDCAAGIREKLHGKTMLRGEFLMRLDRVRADADGFGARRDKVFIGITERASFDGATRRVILRIEEQHDVFLACKIGKTYLT